MARLSRRRTAAVAVLIAAAMVPLAGPASGVLSAGPRAADNTSATITAKTATATSTPRGASRTITLITGDRVVVRPAPGGGYAIQTNPGPGRAGMIFHQSRNGKRQTVLPLDAVGLVASGVVDRKLFDVALLAEHGLDDAGSPELPLLVEYADGGSSRSVRSTLAGGARVVRDLPVVDAVAVRQERRTTSELWKRWTGSAQGKRHAGLGAGVKRVWLDGGVRVNLDRSVAQIGAPQAWQAGVTGKGVKVAVLDTGYDPTHPDLAGRVVGERDFTNDGDVVDRQGHGTHVASTVAGSGAASQGRRKGVAPDADLLIGKVCDRRGGCEPSAVIAGMQWAAGQGARVANLSLGGEPTDGTDPLSQAVNELTAKTGTLFVIAAGNSGQFGEQTVGTPAAADSALAVGSVTKSDTMSPFSSRGPRFGDLALKPDIVAPGSRIVAARAAGTLAEDAVDSSYAELSGTSMATPHVAGAAAILAQRHPDWKAAELRAVLTGSAKGLSGTGVFAQGAGRVDVARALEQRVTSLPAGLNLGTAVYPHHDDPVVTKTVAYRNDGDRPVTLRLSLQVSGPDKRPAPKGLFRLVDDTVTVPANGTATVTVSADPKTAGPDGVYGGWILAEGGTTTVRTPVGLHKEIASYDVTLRMLDRDGAPVRHDDVTQIAFAGVANVRTGWEYWDFLPDGSLKLRLPRGTYALEGSLAVPNEVGQGYQDVTFAAEPTQVVDRDTEIVLDGRRAVEIRTEAPVAGAALASAGFGFFRPLDNGTTFLTGLAVLNRMGPDSRPKMYIVPNRTGSRREFIGFGNAVWARLPADPKPDRDFFLDSPYLYHDAVHWPGRFPQRPALATAPGDYARVDAGYPANLPGSVATNWGFPILPVAGVRGEELGGFMFSPTVEMRLPFRRSEHYAVRGGIRWAHHVEIYRYLNETTSEIEIDAVTLGPTTRYRAGAGNSARWNTAVFGPSLPSNQVGSPGFRPTAPWVSRDGDSLTVSAPMFADSGPGRIGEGVIESEHTTLHRAGKLVGTSDTPLTQVFALPGEDAEYRLAKEVTRPADRTRLSTKVASVWTFRSARTPDGAGQALPLLTVRYAPVLDDHNRAPAGRFEIPVRVERQHGSRPAPIERLDVEASYDDGKSWRTVPVRRSSSGWTAVLDQPGEGFVSLRAKAADQAGNQVEQTITRAYELH